MSRQATWVSTFHVSVEFLKQVIFQTLKESLGSNDEASLCLIYWEPDTCREPTKVGVQVQFIYKSSAGRVRPRKQDSPRFTS
jgi:hypothetical protein